MAKQVTLFGGDVLVDDGLNGAVGGQLGQRLVDGVEQGGVVLVHADGVVLGDVLGVQNCQTGVGSHKGFGGSGVDDHAVNLTVQQSLHGGSAVVIGGDMIVAVITGGVNVAGGAALPSVLPVIFYAVLSLPV